MPFEQRFLVFRRKLWLLERTFRSNSAPQPQTISSISPKETYRLCRSPFRPEDQSLHGPKIDDPSNRVRSEDIEKFYLNDKSFMVVDAGSYVSKIDFSVMLQTDLTTGKQRRIQRNFNLENRCSCFCSPPVSWEHLDATAPYQLIPLDKRTQSIRMWLIISHIMES